MKIRRTIPPAAAPLAASDLLHGFAGLFQGERHKSRREQELKEYFKVRHVYLVSSGKAALAVILRALQTLSPEKKEVLIPAYTCFSVPSAIVKAGLRVALCDIDETTFDFNKEQVEQAITPNTLCVIPDHLFGIPADINRITTLCASRGAYVVEDAAQAMGGAVRGGKLGTFGDVGFFSLGRGKNITCGSGGIIITDSGPIAAAIEKEYAGLEQPGIAENLRELCKAILLALFIRPGLYWLPANLPFLKLGSTLFYRDFPVRKLSGIQAGLLRNWEKRLFFSNRARQENARYLCRRLDIGLCNELPSLLRLPILAENRRTRNSISRLSRERGMGISRMYPSAINRIEEIKDQFQGKSYPAASRVAERLLTIPTHQLLTRKDRQSIIRFIKGIDSFRKQEKADGSAELFSAPDIGSYK